MISAFIWATILLAGTIFEAFSLRRRNDEWQPLTYWVRHVMAYSLLFRIWVIGFLVWLLLHFTIGVA